ncbi:BA75_00877T0 [Komagataella pastoris]|uniref:BA75_00877T0 n=1 Tax=Komagataella pastoris TaxID=4922 RepID=A0A1B2J9N8_PICPA|nr:BA75_00877T0 [Komagataella pastoris]
MVVTGKSGPVEESYLVKDGGSNYSNYECTSQESDVPAIDPVIDSLDFPLRLDEGTEQGDAEHADDMRSLKQDWLLHESTVWYKRPTVAMACLTIFLTSFSVGLSTPSQIVLSIEIICRELNKHESMPCNVPAVQTMLSELQSSTQIIGGLFMVLVSARIGRLSDIYGRKPIFAFIVLFSLISKSLLLVFLNPDIIGSYHKVWLIIIMSLENLGGGMISLLGIVHSYVADIVPVHKRMYSIGLVAVGLYVGMSLGPLLNSVLFSHFHSNILSLQVACILLLVELLLILFFIPESRSSRARNKSRTASESSRQTFLELHRLNQEQVQPLHKKLLLHLTTFFHPLKVLWLPKTRYIDHSDHDRIKSSYIPRTNVIIMVFMDTLMLSILLGFGQVSVIYATYVFDWDSSVMGYFISVSMISKTLTILVLSGMILKLLEKFFRLDKKGVDNIDLTLMRSSFVFELLAMILIINASNSAQFFIATLPAGLASLASPAMHTALLKYGNPNEVGELFGGITFFRNLFILIVPPLLLYVYSQTVAYNPAIALYICLFIIGMVVTSSFFLRKLDLRTCTVIT